MPRQVAGGTSPRTGRRRGSRYRGPDWRQVPPSRWPSPAYCETSSAPAAWSRETFPGSGNRRAAWRPAPPAHWRSRSCFPPAGFRVDASTACVESARLTSRTSMPAMTDIFHLDRLKTPIGVALLVTDDDGVLRALDWEDYEPRMRQLLRLHCGAIELRDAR